MVKGYRWLAVGIAGAALVAPGVARAQGSPVEQPLTQPGTASGLPQAQGSFKPPAQIRPGLAVSVLVFPFGYVAGEAPAAPAAPEGAPAAGAAMSLEQQHIASYLTAAVKAGFLSSPYYSVASYHPNSSLVQRAQKDEILRPEHVTGLIAPATGGPDLEKARTVTYRLGMQGLLVGTIDMKSDPKANTSEVTLETQLINSTTGEVIRSAAVSGAAAGAEGVPLDVVEERAALDAAQKVLPAMGIQLIAPQGEAPKAAPRTRGKRASADRSADASAKAAAADARKAEAAARKAEEAAARKAKDDAAKAARAAREQAEAAEKARREAERKSRSGKASAPEAPTTTTVQKDDPAQTAPPAAPARPASVDSAATPVSVTGGVPGSANAAGQPVPYGYALGDAKSALPARDRKGLRVPAWLGVAGFLYGLSFLVF
jgi:hypothetical protein